MTDQATIARKALETVEAIDFMELIRDKKKLTKDIMEKFGKLGHELGYRVSCHRSSYAAANDPEWMCDMIWWEADGNHNMISAPLVLESEISRPSGLQDDLDGDFQKLVLARAGVRVWISTSPNNAATHIENCKRQIAVFKGSSGDRYVFAVYDWTRRDLVTEDFVAP